MKFGSIFYIKEKNFMIPLEVRVIHQFEGIPTKIKENLPDCLKNPFIFLGIMQILSITTKFIRFSSESSINPEMLNAKR